MSKPQPRLGIDTGGTFTDFAYFDGSKLHSCKVLSTPQAPEQAILQGIRLLGLEPAVAASDIPLIHGTTVATNAALERKGARTAFVTNAGFEDLLTIGRQNRAELYNLTPQKPLPPVPRQLCFGVAGRIDRHGRQLEPIDQASFKELITKLRHLEVEAVAICLLFSWLNDSHEKAVAEAIRSRLPGLSLHLSSEVAPRTGEYERGMATWLNASLSPRVQGYLERLELAIPPERLTIMQSSGGTLSAKLASKRAVQLLLSGPAGGLAAASYLCRQLQEPGLLTFDMGGTSTDVALVRGQPRLTTEGSIGGWPVVVPMVDMHTIGAGGGSIARIDPAGMLHVGPESAGATPGPACYGREAGLVTVTDAHCLLGHLPQSSLGDGGPQLQRAAAAAAIENLDASIQPEALALGILNLAEEHMAGALRKISEQRGEDPADYRLCSFGGAGGLHVCNLAEKMGMQKAIVPAHAGTLSALGMLVAPGLREFTRSLTETERHSPQALASLVQQLQHQAIQELSAEGHPAEAAETDSWLDCRYAGQSFTLQVAWSPDTKSDEVVQRFHELHERTYEYAMQREVEQVNLRVSVRVDSPSLDLPAEKGDIAGPADSCRVFQRNRGWQEAQLWQLKNIPEGQPIFGPALIVTNSATSLIQPGWSAIRLPQGHLLLERQG